MKLMFFCGKGSRHKGEALTLGLANPDCQLLECCWLMRCHLIKASTLISPRSRSTFAASTGTYKHNYTQTNLKNWFPSEKQLSNVFNRSADVTAAIRFRLAASRDKSGLRWGRGVRWKNPGFLSWCLWVTFIHTSSNFIAAEKKIDHNYILFQHCN